MVRKKKFQEKDKFTRVTLFWDPKEYQEIEALYRNCERGEFNQLVLDTMQPNANEYSMVTIVHALKALTIEIRQVYQYFLTKGYENTGAIPVNRQTNQKERELLNNITTTEVDSTQEKGT